MIVKALIFNEGGSRFHAFVDASDVSAVEEAERPMLSGEKVPVCVVTLRGGGTPLFLVDTLGTADTDRSVSRQIRLGMNAGDETAEKLREALDPITAKGGDAEK